MKILTFTIMLAVLLINNYSMVLASESTLAKQNKIPATIVSKIQDEEEECYEESDKIHKMKTNPNDIIKLADLNGDGITDFMFFDSDIYCEAGFSARHGNGGIGVIIFVGTADGGATLSFDNTVYDAKIEKTNSKDVAWITVGGHYCGQETFKSRAEAIICERPLIWNPTTKKLDYAPLSEARFQNK